MKKPLFFLEKTRKSDGFRVTIPVFKSEKAKFHVPVRGDGFHFKNKKSVINHFPDYKVIPAENGKYPHTKVFPKSGYPRRIGKSWWYELSNGEKVLGTDKAEKAQEELENGG